MDRYKSRFSPGNAQRLRQLRLCIRKLVQVCLLSGRRIASTRSTSRLTQFVMPTTGATRAPEELTKCPHQNHGDGQRRKWARLGVERHHEAQQLSPNDGTGQCAFASLAVVAVVVVCALLQTTVVHGVVVDATLSALQINLVDLDDYMETSELCRKLQGFHDKFIGAGVAVHNAAGALNRTSSQPAPARSNGPSKSPLRAVKTLLAALMQLNNDARMKLTYVHDFKGSITSDPHNELRFVMLNPGRHFEEIVTVGSASSNKLCFGLDQISY